MMSTNGAEHVSSTVSIDVGVVSSDSIAPSCIEKFVGLAEEVSISKRWSNEMVASVVAHHILGKWMVGIPKEVGISGDTTLAPVGTVVSGWLPGESI